MAEFPRCFCIPREYSSVRSWNLENKERASVGRIFHELDSSGEKVEGIWNAFAKWNFWIKNLNKTPLNFLKQSSQMNNFTVFFQFFIGI